VHSRLFRYGSHRGERVSKTWSNNDFARAVGLHREGRCYPNKWIPEESGTGYTSKRSVKPRESPAYELTLIGTSPDVNSTSPTVGFNHHRIPTARTARPRGVIVPVEDRPPSLFDSSPGDEESDAASVDLRIDAGDWLERRADLPRASPAQSPSKLWPLLTPRNPLQSLRRLHRAPCVADLTTPENGLRIFPTPPAIELEGSPIPNEAQGDGYETQHDADENRDPQPGGSMEMDEDESSLSAAIALSLRIQNRYTPMGTNLEELQQALQNSLLDNMI
jgi:hypothetical protein